MTKLPRLLRWSVRVYALLLRLLPAPFRQEYQGPMLQLFRDLCLDHMTAHGPVGLVAVWWRALPDLCRGAAGEWVRTLRNGGTRMRLQFISWLVGLAAVLLMILPALFPPRLIVFIGVLALSLAAILLTLRQRRAMAAEPAAALAGALPSASAAAAPSVVNVTTASGLLRVAVVAVAALFVAVLAYVALIAYPQALASGNPERGPVLLHWLGASGARLADLLIATLIVGAYPATALVGTREPRDVAVRPWLVGGGLGAGAGLLMVLIGVLTDLTARTAAESTAGSRATVVLAFGVAALSGILVGKASGQASMGALGGFWAGVLMALLLATGGLFSDVLLAGRLVNSIWVGNLNCPGLLGPALAACSIGAALAGLGNALLFLPIYAAGLGLFGGLVGRALGGRQAPAQPGQAAVLAPLICSMLLFAILVARVGNLW